MSSSQLSENKHAIAAYHLQKIFMCEMFKTLKFEYDALAHTLITNNKGGKTHQSIAAIIRRYQCCAKQNDTELKMSAINR